HHNLDQLRLENLDMWICATSALFVVTLAPAPIVLIQGPNSGLASAFTTCRACQNWPHSRLNIQIANKAFVALGCNCDQYRMLHLPWRHQVSALTLAQFCHGHSQLDYYY